VQGFLLDVNVLIALSWPTHVAHIRVQHWFHRNASAGWATCPITQCAFVRIISNPAFSAAALTPAQALQLLTDNLKHSSHQFWPDELGLVQAFKGIEKRLSGHRQITDAYLLGLAIHHKGKLATLDQGVESLLPNGSTGTELIS
jgi:toxin-antitoxin system PIN domain toxin